MPDEPINIFDAISKVRRNMVEVCTPAMLAHLEQQYSVWRETMSNHGIDVDDNVIGAVMVTCVMLADPRLEETASAYGVTSEDFIVSILSVSVEAGRTP